jgi:hypothetical protein
MEATLGLTDHVEQAVAIEVLKAAATKQFHRRKQFLEDITVCVHNGVIQALAKAFSKS